MEKNKIVGKTTTAVSEAPNEIDLGSYHCFEVVNEKLISTDFIRRLLKDLKRKVVYVDSVLSIPKICSAKFLASLSDNERAVAGECLVMLIDSGRVALQFQPYRR